MGDPAGIGSEIVLKSLARPALMRGHQAIIVGDLGHLRRIQKTILRTHPASRLLLHGIRPSVFMNHPSRSDSFKGVVVVDMKNVKPNLAFGKPMAWAGRASGDYIRFAVKAAIQNKINALVTAPINKKSFHMGGWGRKFVGHTEMLAHLSGCSPVAHMLVYKNMRSVHVTSHLPLRDVSRSLNVRRICEVIELTERGLFDFGIKKPRIAVCGLNPHAGDGGLLGWEEERTIWPAIQHCQKRGICVQGPMSPDVVWPRVQGGHYHAGVAMYHDQGQIPLKLMSFKSSSSQKRFSSHGLSLTLGLPFVRVSVDHGTAYEIAGKGVASEKSMINALKCAIGLVTQRSRNQKAAA